MIPINYEKIKSFRMMDTTITVGHDEKLLYDLTAVGAYNHERLEIQLKLSSENHSIQRVGHTFWHEFSHAALGTLGYPDMKDDEQLVELLGRLIHQCLLTMEFEEDK